jgi:plastocyanin
MKPTAIAVSLAAGAVALVGTPAAGPHSHPGAGAMSDEAMLRQVEAWYAIHPRVGGSAPAPPADLLGVDATFTASGTQFNADGNAGTEVDTVRIDVGQTVLWQWVNGAHTVTSGTGAGDPNAGLIFDQALTTSSRQFFHTFDSGGTFPFFCSPHEGFGMRGVVIVNDPVGVPGGPDGPAIGFAADPWPNPAADGVSFRFSLAVEGRVRADVIDARGRFVATIVDRPFAAGVHGASWDGRGTSGPAAAGAYFLRLHLPGFTGGRSFVLTR